MNWMVTWTEDDGVLYQSGPYERRENAVRQYEHRHTDPLAHNIELWEMTNITPDNVECPRCCGEGTVLETRPLANSNYRPCPLCTPENVECPLCLPGGCTCGHRSDDGCQSLHDHGLPCPHRAPENVDGPTP